MRLFTTFSALALATALALPVAAAPVATAPAVPADPVVASVNGMVIHLSDIQQAAQTAPQQLQQLPANELFPVLLNQEIDRKALLVAAQKEHLERNPEVATAMAAAADVKLENAYVQQKVNPAVSPAAVQAEYNKDYAGKPGPAQVDARHILVKTQAEAQAIIKKLNHGANFAALAKKDSIDPGASNGGELGWFSQTQMVPAFADAAFALKPGQYTKTPVQTQFGWHVILSEGKRTAPPQALAEVQDEIRRNLGDAAIKATLASVRSNVKIELYGPDGKPRPADAADING